MLEQLLSEWTVLHEQIGKNLLTYVDDIVVKSKKREDHIKDLQETFKNLPGNKPKVKP
jgi:hypothetical protein